MSEPLPSQYQLWCNEIRKVKQDAPLTESELILHDHGETCTSCMERVLKELRSLEQAEQLLNRYMTAAMKALPKNWACDTGNPEGTIDAIVRGAYQEGANSINKVTIELKTEPPTSGPWYWTKEHKTQDGQETWSLVSESGYGVLSCDGLPNSPQHCNSADAPLLAAAPELLAALKEILILPQLIGGHNISIPIQNALAAIAKAEGRAQ